MKNKGLLLTAILSLSCLDISILDIPKTNNTKIEITVLTNGKIYEIITDKSNLEKELPNLKKILSEIHKKECLK